LGAYVNARLSCLCLLMQLTHCTSKGNYLMAEITNVKHEVVHWSFGRVSIWEKQVFSSFQQFVHCSCFLDRQLPRSTSMSCSDLVIITIITSGTIPFQSADCRLLHAYDKQNAFMAPCLSTHWAKSSSVKTFMRFNNSEVDCCIFLKLVHDIVRNILCFD